MNCVICRYICIVFFLTRKRLSLVVVKNQYMLKSCCCYVETFKLEQTNAQTQTNASKRKHISCRYGSILDHYFKFLYSMFQSFVVLWPRSWAGWSVRTGAVSYTHLDVYKRQNQCPLCIEAWPCVRSIAHSFTLTVTITFYTIYGFT